MAVDSASLRKHALSLRNMLSEEERANKSLEITKILSGCDMYQKARTLLMYASYQTEVSTFLIMERALAQKKQVFVPKVRGNQMEFYRIFSIENLKPGFRGIWEPEGNTEVWSGKRENGIAEHEHALLVAPGVAFDRFGHRIGYGGGFYDRFLGSIPVPERPCCIGLCFACQLVGQIEPEEHDVAMDLVIYA